MAMRIRIGKTGGPSYKENAMDPTRRLRRNAIRRIAFVTLCVALAGGITVWGNLTEEAQPMPDRVIAFAHQLRLGMSVASFAAYSPTLRDLRLHAQQLINLLEGAGGRHFARSPGWENVPVGLLTEITVWGGRFGEVPWEPEQQTRLAAALRNLRIYLDLALDAALSITQRERLDQATADMLKVYAYLSAANEVPGAGGAVPGLRTIVTAFGITISEEAEG
jgi:hypothetical protein